MTAKGARACPTTLRAAAAQPLAGARCAAAGGGAGSDANRSGAFDTKEDVTAPDDVPPGGSGAEWAAAPEP